MTILTIIFNHFQKSFSISLQSRRYHILKNHNHICKFEDMNIPIFPMWRCIS